MKEITAWKTTDGEVFTDHKEATKHEDCLRSVDSVKDADAVANYVLDNLKAFAVAISPLITKSEPRKPTNWDSIQREGAE